VTVLSDVSLDLHGGEVHALMGGNGAGKSTLMKILQGVYTPDSGEVIINGQPVTLNTPQQAEAAGVAMIFQEFSLIPTLTAAQNIFLNREPRGAFGAIDDALMVRRAREIFADMGVQIDPTREVRELSTGEWQLTEIAKALSKAAKVFIMDEPTAALSATEVQTLFRLTAQLKARGLATVYITHRMDEVFTVGDRVTVMRDGRAVLTRETADLHLDDLIEQIVGRRLEGAMQWQRRAVDRSGPPLLDVQNLQSRGVNGATFQIHPGEIVGLVGLMGSGRTELAETLFGVRRATGGRVTLNGRDVQIGSSEAAIAQGLALVPEDRRLQGLVLDAPVAANLLLPQLGRFTRGGVMQDAGARQYARELVEQLRIKTDSIDKQTRLLSGGNQQKIVLAKWLGNDPRLLILDEPTAGVDIGSKSEIIALIRELADQGKAVLVISSELPELLALSDRLLVVEAGRIRQDLGRSGHETEEDLHRALQGGHRGGEAHAATASSA
jgi:ribose transport system ATP-binding protein